MIVLSTLIPNSAKEKEILKEQSLESDGMENKYLFIFIYIWEELSKISTEKQKSETIITGIQKGLKPTFTSSHQPFGAVPLSQNKQRGAPGRRGRGASLLQRVAFRRG